MTPVELTYRKTAAATGASSLGLLIGLYDTLAGSLRRAAEAERRNELDERCREVNHALMVVGYLEDSLSRGSGGPLAQQLTSFYGSLRRKMVEAQAKRSARILEEQMDVVLKVREQWQALEFRCEPAGPEILAPIQTSTYGPGLQMEEMQLSWSA
ncbi:MAG TPA: flagellar export chaperone FliS [Terracidiphilus sp.]|jgi:flagellar biosynthetic protein FliS